MKNSSLETSIKDTFNRPQTSSRPDAAKKMKSMTGFEYPEVDVSRRRWNDYSVSKLRQNFLR